MGKEVDKKKAKAMAALFGGVGAAEPEEEKPVDKNININPPVEQAPA